mgnify:CR=1 FL=1
MDRKMRQQMSDADPVQVHPDVQNPHQREKNADQT